MSDAHESTNRAVAAGLRSDAAHVVEHPSAEARRKLRAALAAAPGHGAVAHGAPRRRPVALPVAAIGALAAVALALLLIRAPWSVPSTPAVANDTAPSLAMPQVLASLLSVRPIDAVEFVAERPLRTELDALAVDAAAVADAVLRRIPSQLVPNRAPASG